MSEDKKPERQFDIAKAVAEFERNLVEDVKRFIASPKYQLMRRAHWRAMFGVNPDGSKEEP